MVMPLQSAPANRGSRLDAHRAPRDEGGVSPQVRICTPCVQVGGGRWCINLPVFGRKCFSVPSIGRWRACCRTRFGIPPVSCGLERC